MDAFQPFSANRVQGMKPSKHLTEPAGQVRPVAIGRFQRWQRLKNSLDTFCDQISQCQRILDDAHLRPLGDADSRTMNSERVEQAIQEHRVHDHPNIRVLKRHVGLGKEVRRCRFTGSRSRQTKTRQVAVPSILHDAKQGALRGEQLADGQILERSVIAKHVRNVVCQNQRQTRIAVVQAQQLSPQVLGARNQVWADLEDVGQDELFGRGLAQGLRCMLCLRSEQRLVVLCADQSNDGIAELRKQVGKAQAHTSSPASGSPRADH